MRDATNAREAVGRLSRAVDEGERIDDITTLALVADGGERRWSETLKPEVASFHAIRDALTLLVGTGPAAKRAILACDEAFANICNYSEATTVDVSCTYADNTLTVSFSDDGIPFDPLA